MLSIATSRFTWNDAKVWADYIAALENQRNKSSCLWGAQSFQSPSNLTGRVCDSLFHNKSFAWLSPDPIRLWAGPIWWIWNWGMYDKQVPVSQSHYGNSFWTTMLSRACDLLPAMLYGGVWCRGVGLKFWRRKDWNVVKVFLVLSYILTMSSCFSRLDYRVSS